jgi:hypothetical protein
MIARLSVMSPNCIPDGILGRSFSLTPMAALPPPHPCSSREPPNAELPANKPPWDRKRRREMDEVMLAPMI